ncbi:MAG: precorrin-8X methylmutase [Nitrospiraceae bacterium]|nr:precorrin-8X methylmutase [Nitrospiraceae bacterium]
MEAIILVGHGSPKKDANRMDFVGRWLHAMLHPGCAGSCVRFCYLQFAKPDLKEAIGEAVKDLNPRRIVIHPYFLSPGMHVTRDIPEIIEEARALYHGVDFICTEPLGVASGIVRVARERIEAAGGIAPLEIEKRSFAKIMEEAERKLGKIPASVRPVVQRVVHATGDFEFINTLIFHPDAVAAGLDAIKRGMDIVTDVNMARVGINEKTLSRFGGKAVCGMDGAPGGDVKTKTSQDKSSKTRAERGIGLAARHPNAGIIAIGNAPTALYECMSLINRGEIKPGLVIGVPVGFVRAVEAKALLASMDFPFITNAGRKGGSAVAAAIVNALLVLAGRARENEHENKNVS